MKEEELSEKVGGRRGRKREETKEEVRRKRGQKSENRHQRRRKIGGMRDPAGGRENMNDREEAVEEKGKG